MFLKQVKQIPLYNFKFSSYQSPLIF